MEKKNKYEIFFDLQQRVKKIGVDARNEHFKFDYVTLGKLLTTIQPILVEMKLSYSQPLIIKEGRNALRTEIVSVDLGEIIAESEAFLVTRSDNNPQDFGGAITYQRRYQLFSLLGLVGDKDDDCLLTNDEIKKRIKAAKTPSELTKVFSSIPAEQQEDLKEEFSKRKQEIIKTKEQKEAETLQNATVKE